MAHADASPPVTPRTLAELLRTARVRALLTQEELAQRAGLSVRAIRNLESGRVMRPRSGSVRLLADALGLVGDERDAFGAFLGAEPPATDPPDPPGQPVPAQLPADVAGFTGREDYLRRLDALLTDQSPGGARSVGIVTITGPAGVGKTALAIHWAHRAARRFPDGQLYVDLRGRGSGNPVGPLPAVAAMLRSLGTEAERIPVEIGEAAGLFRSLLAGRRLLVLLDNALDAEQVRPLLPGAPGCQVLVTSRDRLTGLVATHGAQNLTLDVLDRSEAVAVLEQVLGRPVSAADSEAIDELARICAYLPLALRIAAANVAGRPEASVADHVVALREGDLLERLEVAGDPQVAVRAAFDQSYERLGPDTRALFRLAACTPGTSLTVPSAAALTGTDHARAVRLLEMLAKAHLLETRTPGRYAYHDLLHRYANDRARAEDGATGRRAAVHRLCAWYLHCVDVAARLLYPRAVRLPVEVTDTPPAPFDDDPGALAWLDAEWANLAAMITTAAADRPPAMVWALADALRGFLWTHRNPVDHLAIASAALEAATDDGDLAAQAAAEMNLGDAYQCRSAYPQAIAHYTRGRDLARRAGRPAIEAGNVLNLGNIAGDVGNLAEAIEHQTTALALFRGLDEAKGGASALGNLGNLHWERGDLDRAAEYQHEALALYRKIDNRVGEAACLDSLGEIALVHGQLDVADRYLTEAIRLHREVGDRYGEAYGLGCLAMLQIHCGEPGRALDLARTALNLAEEIGDHRTQAETHNTLGAARLSQGRPEQATRHYQCGLDLARETGTRYAETIARLGLASTRLATGDHTGAHADAERGLSLARSVGYGLLEGQALTILADVALARGEHGPAVEQAQAAARVHRATGQSLWLRRTLSILERAAGTTH